jgi:hypothetical protein
MPWYGDTMLALFVMVENAQMIHSNTQTVNHSACCEKVNSRSSKVATKIAHLSKTSLVGRKGSSFHTGTSTRIGMLEDDTHLLTILKYFGLKSNERTSLKGERYLFSTGCQTQVQEKKHCRD